MKKPYIGLDLGGTNLRAALVDVENGSVLFQQSTLTLGHEGHDAVMQRMMNLIVTMLETVSLQTSDIGGVGIGVPGLLDLEKGETLFLPNLPGTWPHVPLRDVLQQKLGVPVALLNDVRSITFGEWRFGAGQGKETIAVLAVGTGIGGGLVINGQLHLGMGGSAGELGHMVIDPNGPRCGCGNYGCLEALASGPSIAAMGMKAVAQGLTTAIGELCGYNLNSITPALIADAAEQGDEIACEIYRQAGFYLGIAACNICVSISPSRIILTGGVANAGRLLLEPMERTMRERVHLVPVDQVDIVPGKLGNLAGVIGAACWAANCFENF